MAVVALNGGQTETAQTTSPTTTLLSTPNTLKIKIYLQKNIGKL